MTDMAELFDTIAFCCTEIAQAIRDGDGIAGTLASDGLMTNLGCLPSEMRQVLVESLSV